MKTVRPSMQRSQDVEIISSPRMPARQGQGASPRRRARSSARQGPRRRRRHQGVARRGRAPDDPHSPGRVLARQGGGGRSGLVAPRHAPVAGRARGTACAGGTTCAAGTALAQAARRSQCPLRDRQVAESDRRARSSARQGHRDRRVGARVAGRHRSAHRRGAGGGGVDRHLPQVLGGGQSLPGDRQAGRAPPAKEAQPSSPKPRRKTIAASRRRAPPLG